MFSFIAAPMPDDRGVVLLALTLGLFQNGSIRHVGGKRIPNVRTDTLSDPAVVRGGRRAGARAPHAPPT